MSQAIQHLDLATARRILRGDQVSFRRLFDDYFPRLYRFSMARLHGDREASGEVVQQTFCRAIEHLDSYRGEAALYTWFCQICANLIIDHYRRQSREDRRVVFIEDNPEVQAILNALTLPSDEGGEAELIRRDVTRLVQATLDHLPEKYGDILEWKYLDEMSVADIAERLSLSAKAAESLLARARFAFRDALANLGGADGIPGVTAASRRER